jgi:hypothetical protein
VVFGLVDHVLDTLVEEQWGHELLCIAARVGCLPMIQRLLNRAQHRPTLRAELLRSSNSIGEAVLGSHVGVVDCLLGEEAPQINRDAILQLLREYTTIELRS